MFTAQLTVEALKSAFAIVKHNRGAGGIDRISLTQYEQNLGNSLPELLRLLQTNTYQPLPVKRVDIPKANGKTRPLGIPTIRDRIVQQVILTEIQPQLEPLFHDSSFGFRPGKSAHQAIDQIQEYLNQGYTYIVDADIRDFFGTLNQQILMAKVRDTIPDRSITHLIWKFLRAVVMAEGQVRTATAGTPQGGVISPLLANLYLNDFDHALEKAGLKLVRYADDFVILCQSVNQSVMAMRRVKQLLKKLKLELAPEKTRITDYKTGFDFLGYRFQQFYGNKRWPKHQAVEAFKNKVRKFTRRQQPKNVKEVITNLNPLIRGWGNYFKHGNSKKRFEQLDGWIRMRLKSFIEKKKWPSGLNWKYPTDHFRQLGLVFLTPLLTNQTMAQQLSLPALGQPARRAVCGQSARTVR